MTCEEITALLTLAPVCGARPGTGAEAEPDEVLSADEAARLDEHLSGCEACREVAAALTNAYRGLDEAIEERTTMQPMTTDLRERTLAAVRDTLAHDAEPAQKKEPAAAPEPGPDPRAVDAIGKKIALACSYCHDRATRDEVLFCASCLAPHHRECFETHGTCTLPGCGETRTVRPADAPSFAEPSSRRPRNWLAIPMLIGVAGAGAVAALAARTGAKAFTAPPTPNVAVPSPEDTDLPPPSPTDETDAKPAGTFEVALSAPATPAIDALDIDIEQVDLAEVMERIGRQVGRNILVDPGVQESVTVSLRSIPWREAVAVIARMCRCEVEERDDGLLVLTQCARVTIQFTDANVRTILQLLAAYSGKNLILGPDIRGTLTVDFRETDWWQALQIVAENRKLHLVRCQGDAVIITAAPLDPAILAGLPVLGAAAGGDAGPPVSKPPRARLQAADCPATAWFQLLAGAGGFGTILDGSRWDDVTVDLSSIDYETAARLTAASLGVAVKRASGGTLSFVDTGGPRIVQEPSPVDEQEARLGALIADVARLARAASGAKVAERARLTEELEARQAELRGLLAPAAPRMSKADLYTEANERGELVREALTDGPPEKVDARMRELLEILAEGRPRAPGVLGRVRRLGEAAMASELRVRGEQADQGLAALDDAVKAERWAAVRATRERLDAIVMDLAERSSEEPVAALVKRIEVVTTRAREEGRVRDLLTTQGRVQAILLSDELQAAVINGVVYRAGDTLLDANGDVTEGDARITVNKIDDGVVVLEVNGTPFTQNLGSD